MHIIQFFTKSLRSRLILYFTLLMMVALSVAGYLIYTVSDEQISDGALRLITQIVEKDNESVNAVLYLLQDGS